MHTIVIVVIHEDSDDAAQEVSLRVMYNLVSKSEFDQLLIFIGRELPCSFGLPFKVDFWLDDISLIAVCHSLHLFFEYECVIGIESNHWQGRDVSEAELALGVLVHPID